MRNKGKDDPDTPENPSPGEGNVGGPYRSDNWQICEMEVGEVGFVDESAIILDLRGHIYINVYNEVESIQNTKYSIPIKRVGENATDYDIDFDNDFNETILKEVWSVATHSKNNTGTFLPQYFPMTLDEYCETFEADTDFDEEIEDYDITRERKPNIPPRNERFVGNGLEQIAMTIEYNFSLKESPKTYRQKQELMEKVENGDYDCILDYIHFFEESKEPLNQELKGKLLEIYAKH